MIKGVKVTEFDDPILKFLQQIEAMGYFDDSEDEEESDFLSLPGPAG